MSSKNAQPSPQDVQPSEGVIPQFRQPSPRSPRHDPSPSPAPTRPAPSSAPDFDADDVDGSGWDEATPETLTGSSSPESTDRPRPVGALLDAGSREAYAQMVTIGATAVSGLVDLRAGAGTGAFVMREDEAAEIAGPASRILARRFPMGGAGASEASDVFGLIMGVAGWVMGSMRRRAEVFAQAGDESGSWAPMGDPTPAGGYEHGGFDVQEETVAPPAPRPYFPGAAPLPRVNS